VELHLQEIVQATARNGTNGAKGHVPGHFEAGGKDVPGLVNIEKAFENGHRNSGFSHEKL